MDSDAATSTPPSGKIHRCSCGRRMGGLIHDFHTVCVICRGIDCDDDHLCPECNDVSNSVMSKYVVHKLSLKCKLQSKCSKKDPVPASAVASDSTDVAAESAVAEPAASPVPAPVVSPVRVDSSSQGVSSDIMCQVKSL